MSTLNLNKVLLQNSAGTEAFYPQTSTDMVFNENGENVDDILNTKAQLNHNHDNTYALINHTHDEHKFTRYKETIFPSQDGQHTFTLTKGTYTLNANCLDVTIDGIPQPSGAYTEVNETTFTLSELFNIKTTTQIDVSYMKVCNIVNEETLQEANNYTDERFNSISLDWDSVENKPSEFTPSAHNHDVVTTTTNGIMLSADKVKLDNITITKFGVENGIPYIEYE